VEVARLPQQLLPRALPVLQGLLALLGLQDPLALLVRMVFLGQMAQMVQMAPLDPLGLLVRTEPMVHVAPQVPLALLDLLA